ncbi:MAG: inositol monophosphatase family protein [Pseudomonadota bacterium]
MHPMINIALRAARQASEMIVRNADRIDSLSIDRKSSNDYATEIDLAAEKEIIYHLHKAYPEHAILTEEAGLIEPLKQSEHDYKWIIDPLDGTQNFIHGIPHFCVSIACLHNNVLTHAVIVDPIRNEEFIASRGRGAQLNGKRIRVSEKSTLEDAMVLIGIPSLPRQTEYQTSYLNCMTQLQSDFNVNFRNGGSSALNLAYIAAGRADAYFEPSLRQWDIAAGALLVQEAGGFVCDFSGGNSHLESGNTVAANKKCFKPVLKAVQSNLGSL